MVCYSVESRTLSTNLGDYWGRNKYLLEKEREQTYLDHPSNIQRGHLESVQSLGAAARAGSVQVLRDLGGISGNPGLVVFVNNVYAGAARRASSNNLPGS